MLARLIAAHVCGNLRSNQFVVAIDGDNFNLRRKNLQVVNGSDHARISKPKHSSSSKYKGLCFIPGRRRWRVSIRINGRDTYVGSYASEHEAASAYDSALCQSEARIAYFNFNS